MGLLIAMDQEYDKYVREKHGRWNTSDAILFPEITVISNLTPVSKHRIIKGENSEVYKIATEEGVGLIARISHHHNPRFERERWAINQVKAVGVPVPEVLGIKEIETENGIITLSLENELKGIPFEEIPGIDDPESARLVKKIMNEAGAILAQIHSVETVGYGALDNAGNGKWETLSDVWLEMEKWRESIEEVAAQATTDSGLLIRALDLMKTAAANAHFSPPVLVHDDYAPKHIMVDGEKITGIIDFESCEGGDPVRDFARWEYHKRDFPVKYLLEGYSGDLTPDFDARLKLWKVHMALTTLEFYIEDGNKAAIANTVSRLEEDLEFFN